jgi:transposase-like protein
VGLYDEPGIPVCPQCGSNKLQRRGEAVSVMNKYQRYQCKSCGTWSRDPIGELNKVDRLSIVRKIN